MSRGFVFDLYRLNIVDVEDLLVEKSLPTLRTDDDLVKVLVHATNSDLDQPQETRTAVFKWSVRDYVDLSEEVEGRNLHHVVLARSVVEKDGLIVTGDGLHQGTSSFDPPLATAAVCIFDLTRHLVAIEHSGELSQTAWHDFFEKILSASSSSLHTRSKISLEPVPEDRGIVGIFESFQTLVRMKLTIRIPNPELNRFTKKLFEDLTKSEIRELTQDMKNPTGISKEHDALPYASAVLAEQGYKDGDVKFEGYINDNFEKITSGGDARRGTIDNLRDYVRGIGANARSKETKAAAKSITEEIDRISPQPDSEN